VVCGVKDHAPLATLGKHRLTGLRQRNTISRLDTERPRQVRIGNRPGARAQVEPEQDVEDDVPRLGLEQGAAVGEPAVSMGEGPDLLRETVPDPNRVDHLRDLLAVRADVLDRG